MENRIPAQIDNPFKNRSWHKADVQCVVLLSKSKERILVGTWSAIRERLETRRQSPTSPHEVEPVLPVPSAERIHAVGTFVREFFISNPIEAHKKYRTELDQYDIDFLPLLSDCTYDLGHSLLAFEYDPSGDWPQAIQLLQKALDFKKSKKSFEARAVELLLKKWRSADPICQYAALRIWQEYLRETELFSYKMQTLTCAFSIPPSEPQPTRKEISQFDSVLRVPLYLSICEEQITTWSPSTFHAEYLVVKDSFIPLKLYYRKFLNSHSIKFRICTVCGKVFFTPTKNQKTCSKQCTDARTKMTKAKYDEKARADTVETVWKQSYQHWHNRLVKARKIPDFPLEKLNAIETAFTEYRKDSLAQKHLVQNLKISLSQYQSWLFQQDIKVQTLMGEYEARLDRKNHRTD